MKKYFLQIIFVFATTLTACSNQHVIELTAAAFNDKLQTTSDAVLLDVRTSNEFATEHIEHAKNIDWNNEKFKIQAEQLDKSKPVFVYCLSGGRSASAAEFLKAAGFNEVYELQGGIMKWKAAGLPVATNASLTEMAAIDDMSVEDFQKLLQTDKYVLVDFYATWCGPCKQMEPDLKDIAETMKDKVILVRIDVDKNPTLSKHFEIESLPTIQIYKNQKLVWEDIGYKTKKQLMNQLK